MGACGQVYAPHGGGPATGDEWIARHSKYPPGPAPVDLERLDDDQEGAA